MRIPSNRIASRRWTSRPLRVWLGAVSVRGHASISRLHQFPIDEVKIGRSFVTPTDERTRAYLKAIIRFGRSLGLRVVAEGVEEEETLTFLREQGCDVAQGYHIGRPLPAGQIQDWLSDNACVDVTGAAARTGAPPRTVRA